MAKTLEELVHNRIVYRDAVKLNDFDNFKTLLANMYPEEAHFIYELLQNAEDKGAKYVKFQLFKDKLVFEHDGGVYDKSKLFSLNDIDSITSTGGRSTKVNDPTSIGKFGVGFKAVFAYTNTPRIYSGDYSFEIQDVVVPVIIDKYSSLKEGITRFEFPFNVDSKTVSQCVDEIEKGLKTIKRTTLLFLKNINSIQYELSDGSKGEYIKENEDEHHVSLLSFDGESHYLKFNKDLSFEDIEDNNKLKQCTISIAFNLELNDKTGIYEIMPVKGDNVFIYFPAEKENSNFKFIINAPFASTIARDSVRNCKSNELLIQSIANLLKEVLQYLHDNQYMNLSLLKVWPNNADEVSEFYFPIYKTIIEEYNKKPYFLTKDDKLDYLKNVVRTRAIISELISTNELRFLSSNKDISFLKNPNQTNQDEDKFLQQFNIPKINLSDIIKYTDYDTDFISDYLTKKDNSWLYKFYLELAEEDERTEKENIIKNGYTRSFSPIHDLLVDYKIIKMSDVI